MQIRFSAPRFAAAAFVLVSAFGGMPARAEVKPGSLAPDFTATDTSGKEVKLSALKGKTVVLEWTNNECPYVNKHYSTGNMQAMQADATGKGVVWLIVNSGAPGLQGHVNALEANKIIDDRKAKASAYLLDPKGGIGRAYNAVVTPHMFVIDGAGKVAYMGAVDDKPTANHADVKTARSYVREALAAVAEGKAPQVAATRPYGCSVKYSTPKS